jgi:uncharacterized protein (TIGR02246 family)
MDFDQMVREYLEAIKHRDLQRVLSLFSIDEDVYLILLNGTPINGRSAFINLQAAWFSDPDWQLDYKVLRTIEKPEMAYALLLVDYSDASLKEDLYNKPQHVSLVFTRKDDRWCLVHDQTTVAL